MSWVREFLWDMFVPILALSVALMYDIGYIDFNAAVIVFIFFIVLDVNGIRREVE